MDLLRQVDPLMLAWSQSYVDVEHPASKTAKTETTCSSETNVVLRECLRVYQDGVSKDQHEHVVHLALLTSSRQVHWDSRVVPILH